MVGDRPQKADKSRVLGSDAEAWDSGLERGVKVHRSRRGAVSICGCLGMNQDRRDRGSQRKWWRFSVDGERETMGEGERERTGGRGADQQVRKSKRKLVVSWWGG